MKCKINQSEWFHLILIVVLTATLIGCVTNNLWPPAIVEYSVTNLSNVLNLIWSRSGVTIEPKDNLIITTIDEAVVFNGSLALDEPRSITALDAYNGQLLWQLSKGHLASLQGVDDIVYIGGTSTISAHKGQDGHEIWMTELPFSGEVVITHVSSTTIQVNTEERKFYSIATNSGERISTQEYECCNIYLQTENVTIKRSTNINGISLIDLKTGMLAWNTEFPKGYNQPPTVTDDFIFIRTGDEVGDVYAISRDSGEILWQTENIVSNIAVLDRAVFVLRSDGVLLRIESESGEIYNQLQFRPNNLILQDQQGYKRGFYVVADKVNKIVFIYLGDSTQLFAFQF